MEIREDKYTTGASENEAQKSATTHARKNQVMFAQ